MKLVDYIRKNTRYDILSIRRHLINSGYSAIEVDRAIDQAVNPDISEYVKEQLERGHSQKSIKAHLKQYGYSSKQVNSVVHIHKLHIPSIIITIALLSIAVIIGLSTYSHIDGAGELLDVDLALKSTTIQIGESLEFTVYLSNPGSSRRYDVPLTYQIISGSKVLTEKTETVGIETKFSKIAFVQIPELTPDIYELKVIALYGSQQAIAAARFEIRQEIPELENTQSDFSKMPITEDVRNLNNYEQESTISEVFQSLRTLDTKDLKEARKLCQSIKEKYNSDRCYQEAALKIPVSNLCSSIQNPQLRNTCFLKFGIFGRSDVCVKITDNTMRNLCHASNSMSEISEYNFTAFKIINFSDNQTLTLGNSSVNISKELGANNQDNKVNKSIGSTQINPSNRESNSINQNNSRACDDRCLEQVSIQNWDYAPCGKISNIERADDCYLNYVIVSIDTAACKFIVNNDLRNDCFTI